MSPLQLQLPDELTAPLTWDTYTHYGHTLQTYRYTPDESLDPAPEGAVPVAELPALDLTPTARRLLTAIRDSGLPWGLSLEEAISGGQVVGLRVHHLTGKWSLARWAWHQRRLVYRPHMSPTEALRRLPAAIAAHRREYRCAACGAWSRWVRGRTHEGTSPDCALWWTTGRALPRARVPRVIMCLGCDAAAVVDDCQSREGSAR